MDGKKINSINDLLQIINQNKEMNKYTEEKEYDEFKKEISNIMKKEVRRSVVKEHKVDFPEPTNSTTEEPSIEVSSTIEISNTADEDHKEIDNDINEQSEIGYKLYNQEQKEHYLEEYPDDLFRFRKSRKLEEYYGKDLCEFNIEEIKDLLLSIKSSSIFVLYAFIVAYAKYTDFCISKRYTTNKMNYFLMVSTEQEDLQAYIDKDLTRSIYKMPGEMEEIYSQLFNSSDVVILGMIYEGLSGDQMSGLSYARKDDIDEENNTMTIRDQEEQIIETKCITNKLTNAIIATKREKTYISYSSEKEIPLHETNYLLNQIDDRGVEKGFITTNAIYGRIRKALKFLGEPYRIGALAYSQMLFFIKAMEFARVFENAPVENRVYELTMFLGYTGVNVHYSMITKIKKVYKVWQDNVTVKEDDLMESQYSIDLLESQIRSLKKKIRELKKGLSDVSEQRAKGLIFAFEIIEPLVKDFLQKHNNRIRETVKSIEGKTREKTVL